MAALPALALRVPPPPLLPTSGACGAERDPLQRDGRGGPHHQGRLRQGRRHQLVAGGAEPRHAVLQ